MKERDEKLKQISRWANDNNDARLLLLTSSLANPLAPVDDLIEENWNALFEYADQANQLGAELSEILGYNYPGELEKNIRDDLKDIRSGWLKQPTR